MSLKALLGPALGLLLMRSALPQMDVPTRSSYVTAVVTTPERPVAAGITSVPRSPAAALNSALAGVLFAVGGPAAEGVLQGLKLVAIPVAVVEQAV